MPDAYIPPSALSVPITHCPPPAPRSWAPAQYGFVVQMWRAPGARLVMFQRGEIGHCIILHPNTFKLTERQLEHLAERKNRKIGVPRAAARALGIDRGREFAEPPIDPIDMAAYDAGEDARRRALRGDRSVNAASEGWIRISISLHYYGPGPAVTTHRYVQLAAYYETEEWARQHGRSDRRKMTRKERAAFDFLAAARALSDLHRDYRNRFSRWQEELSRRSGDRERVERIRSADQVKRRADLLALRAARRPVLCRMIAARAAYAAVRPGLFVEVRP